MSTEINLEKLYDDSVKILTDLIGFRTISGEDNSALIDYCEEHLHRLGATSFKTFDEEKKRVNLFATLKAKKTNGIKPISSTISRCSAVYSVSPFSTLPPTNAHVLSYLAPLRNTKRYLLVFLLKKSAPTL